MPTKSAKFSWQEIWKAWRTGQPQEGAGFGGFLQNLLDCSAIWILRLLQLPTIIIMIAMGHIGVTTIMNACWIFISTSDHGKLTASAAAKAEAAKDFAAKAAIAKDPPAIAEPVIDVGAKGEVEKEIAAQEKIAECAVIQKAFTGLELLLLAPLFFLLIRSLTGYVEDQNMEAAPPGSHSGAANQQFRLGKLSLLETKALSIGLLFAIVATYMVSRLISDGYSSPAMDQADSVKMANWREICVGLALLVLLSGIYFGMELLARTPKNDEPKSDRNTP